MQHEFDEAKPSQAKPTQCVYVLVCFCMFSDAVFIYLRCAYQFACSHILNCSCCSEHVYQLYFLLMPFSDTFLSFSVVRFFFVFVEHRKFSNVHKFAHAYEKSEYTILAQKKHSCQLFFSFFSSLALSLCVSTSLSPVITNNDMHTQCVYYTTPSPISHLHCHHHRQSHNKISRTNTNANESLAKQIGISICQPVYFFCSVWLAFLLFFWCILIRHKFVSRLSLTLVVYSFV